MGANAYFYFTKYQSDINIALQELRQQEFEAGRYDPAMNMHDPDMWMFKFEFPPNVKSISPGAKHSSIEEAIKEAVDCGTCSILDIVRISDSPESSAACPLSPEALKRLFGTIKPTRELVEKVICEEESMVFWEDGYDMFDDFWNVIWRGQGRYIILYDGEDPSEIFFAGYSWD
ncbi:hypothetical protein [Pseudanabaena sp. 'Roaring Creek']|uniref:hypothetical protein n=1 Tax=Pseudanabaena sp. 'Roaring Creek' TaxID=1681830 RepID=UPI0006D857AA|nr:hypothetical protein [Pseudanabaena sp. 'Roaring Creek']